MVRNSVDEALNAEAIMNELKSLRSQFNDQMNVIQKLVDDKKAEAEVNKRLEHHVFEELRNCKSRNEELTEENKQNKFEIEKLRQDYGVKEAEVGSLKHKVAEMETERRNFEQMLDQIEDEKEKNMIGMDESVLKREFFETLDELEKMKKIDKELLIAEDHLNEKLDKAIAHKKFAEKEKMDFIKQKRTDQDCFIKTLMNAQSMAGSSQQTSYTGNVHRSSHHKRGALSYQPASTSEGYVSLEDRVKNRDKVPEKRLRY